MASDVSKLRQAGAAGVAVVSAICEAEEPPRPRHASSPGWWTGDRPHSPGAQHCRHRPDRWRRYSSGSEVDCGAWRVWHGRCHRARCSEHGWRAGGARCLPPHFSETSSMRSVTTSGLTPSRSGCCTPRRSWRRSMRGLPSVEIGVVVLDPVMVATSGDRLLDKDAEEAVRRLSPNASRYPEPAGTGRAHRRTRGP